MQKGVWWTIRPQVNNCLTVWFDAGHLRAVPPSRGRGGAGRGGRRWSRCDGDVKVCGARCWTDSALHCPTGRDSRGTLRGADHVATSHSVSFWVKIKIKMNYIQWNAVENTGERTQLYGTSWHWRVPALKLPLHSGTGDGLSVSRMRSCQPSVRGRVHAGYR